MIEYFRRFLTKDNSMYDIICLWLFMHQFNYRNFDQCFQNLAVTKQFEMVQKSCLHFSHHIDKLGLFIRLN